MQHNAEVNTDTAYFTLFDESTSFEGTEGEEAEAGGTLEDGSITIPAVTVSGLIAPESIPLPGVRVTGEIVMPLQGRIDLPAVRVTGQIVTGGVLVSGDLRLPRIEVSGFGATDQVRLPLPGLTVTGEILAGSLATSGNLAICPVDVSGLILSPRVLASGTIRLGLDVSGEIVVGGLARAEALSLPGLTVTGEILAGGLLTSGDLRLPAVTVEGAGYTITAIESGSIRIPLTVSGTIFGPAVGSAAASGHAFSLNTSTLALTRYEAFAFNSFAALGDRVLAAGSDGIRLLDGKTDAGAPIEATFTTGHIDFGVKQLARLVSLYVSYRAAGALRITVRADDLVEHAYVLDASRGAGLYRNRAKLGRGLRARYYQLTFANTLGADFSIDRIEPETIATARRIA